MEKRVYLPEEIISQIITSSGLDLKSMIKCMVVSKMWRNLVSDHITDHITSHYKGHFLVYDYSQRGRYRFGALDEETNQIAWMYGQPHLKRAALTTSSCNGLVCFQSPDSEAIYICNPLTGECTSIPYPQPQPQPQLHVHKCNLGFCSSSNEYKLTCLTRRTLETCTLGSPAGWRSVPFDREKIFFPWRAAVCVNGVVHWLLISQSILTFDLATEVLGTIPPPRLEDGKQIYQLACMDHCLVVTAGYYPPSDLEIWAKKEDKLSGEPVWTKNWLIEPLNRANFYKLVPQTLSTDRQIIMRDHYGLYNYDSRDKLVRLQWKCGFHRRLDSYYTPTLIFPKKL